MAIFDTTFLIDLMRGKEEVRKILNEIEEKEKILAISTPSVMELWTGAILFAKSEEEKQRVLDVLDSFLILDFTINDAKEAAEIEAELTKKGEKIQTEDCMIAGIARQQKEKLITKDGHFTRINGLIVLKY